MAKIKSQSEIKKLKKEAAEIVAEAKRRERKILEKIKEEEKESYAEIGKKAVALFNGKMSEDEFKNLLISYDFLEKVEEKSDEAGTDFSSENKNNGTDNTNIGAQNDL